MEEGSLTIVKVGNGVIEVKRSLVRASGQSKNFCISSEEGKKSQDMFKQRRGKI
jgi:hypothetical protein